MINRYEPNGTCYWKFKTGKNIGNRCNNKVTGTSKVLCKKHIKSRLTLDDYNNVPAEIKDEICGCIIKKTKRVCCKNVSFQSNYCGFHFHSKFRYYMTYYHKWNTNSLQCKKCFLNKRPCKDFYFLYKTDYDNQNFVESNILLPMDVIRSIMDYVDPHTFISMKSSCKELYNYVEKIEKPLMCFNYKHSIFKSVENDKKHDLNFLKKPQYKCFLDRVNPDIMNNIKTVIITKSMNGDTTIQKLWKIYFNDSKKRIESDIMSLLNMCEGWDGGRQSKIHIIRYIFEYLILNKWFLDDNPKFQEVLKSKINYLKTEADINIYMDCIETRLFAT